MLWTFEGRAGQIVDIAMTDADSDFDSYLTLRGEKTARWLRTTTAVASSTPASKVSLSSPMEPTSSRSARRECGFYEFLIVRSEAATIEMGQTVTSTTQSDPSGLSPGQAGQIVYIAMTTEGPSFDPYLTLYGARGTKLA